MAPDATHSRRRPAPELHDPRRSMLPEPRLHSRRDLRAASIQAPQSPSSPARPPGWLTISELASRSRVTKPTIHHYCAIGILPPPVKTAQNMAYYAPECVERIEVVRMLAERRVPLAEAKSIIEEHGLRATREALERTRLASAGLSHVIERPGMRMTRSELEEVSGLARGDLAYLEEAGLIRMSGSSNASGEALFDSLSVDLVKALAQMRAAGMTEEAGFSARDVKLYQDAMSRLVEEELRYFDSRLLHAVPPARMLEVMGAALEHAEELFVIVHRRLLLQALERLAEHPPEHPLEHPLVNPGDRSRPVGPPRGRVQEQPALRLTRSRNESPHRERGKTG